MFNIIIDGLVKSSWVYFFVLSNVLKNVVKPHDLMSWPVFSKGAQALAQASGKARWGPSAS